MYVQRKNLCTFEKKIIIQHTSYIGAKTSQYNIHNTNKCTQPFYRLDIKVQAYIILGFSSIIYKHNVYIILIYINSNIEDGIHKMRFLINIKFMAQIKL